MKRIGLSNEKMGANVRIIGSFKWGDIGTQRKDNSPSSPEAISRLAPNSLPISAIQVTRGTRPPSQQNLLAQLSGFT